VSGQLHGSAALLPGKEPTVPIGYRAGWATESVWTTRRGNFWPYRDSNSGLSVVQPVAIRYTDCANPALYWTRSEDKMIFPFKRMYIKPSLIRLQLIWMSDNPDRKMKNAVHSWVHTLKATWHLGRQMSHLSVQTELYSFFKPASLRSETSTASEPSIDV
jgi:hypothetical protein